MRLLALGVLPHGINAVCLGLARVRRQFVVLFAIQAAQAVPFVALTVVLLPAIGIVGVGVAFLMSQAAVAAVALLWQILPLLRSEQLLSLPPALARARAGVPSESEVSASDSSSIESD